MVFVQLEQDWTDDDGTHHPAGATVDVDAATLAELQADGIVGDPDSGGWVGPTGGNPDSGGWVGPTGGDPTGGGSGS